MNDTYTEVTKKIKETLALAKEKFNVDFPMPVIIYNLKGHTAGQAFFNKNKIRLNRYLLEKYGQEFIDRTVVHEVGHLISYRLYGVNGRGHEYGHDRGHEYGHGRGHEYGHGRGHDDDLQYQEYKRKLCLLLTQKMQH